MDVPEFPNFHTMPLLPKINLKLEAGYSDHMTKEQLVDIIERLPEIDADLDFLSKLSKSELETLVGAVRDRSDYLISYLSS